MHLNSTYQRNLNSRDRGKDLIGETLDEAVNNNLLLVFYVSTLRVIDAAAENNFDPTIKLFHYEIDENVEQYLNELEATK